MHVKNDCRAWTVILNWHLSAQWQQSQLLLESVYSRPVHLSLLILLLHRPSLSPRVVSLPSPSLYHPQHQRRHSRPRNRSNFSTASYRVVFWSMLTWLSSWLCLEGVKDSIKRSTGSNLNFNASTALITVSLQPLSSAWPLLSSNNHSILQKSFGFGQM